MVYLTRLSRRSFLLFEQKKKQTVVIAAREFVDEFDTLGFAVFGRQELKVFFAKQ
jgi:hypothetical protein